MWVADYGAMRIFAYDLTTRARQESREFDLYRQPGESYNPYGIWSNGDTLLVSNWIGGEVIVHNLGDGERRQTLDISTLPQPYLTGRRHLVGRPNPLGRRRRQRRRSHLRLRRAGAGLDRLKRCPAVGDNFVGNL